MSGMHPGSWCNVPAHPARAHKPPSARALPKTTTPAPAPSSTHLTLTPASSSTTGTATPQSSGHGDRCIDRFGRTSPAPQIPSVMDGACLQQHIPWVHACMHVTHWGTSPSRSPPLDRARGAVWLRPYEACGRTSGRREKVAAYWTWKEPPKSQLLARTAV